MGLQMKKILGFIFQFTALVTLGYMFLNSSLLLVADWLSPILSGQIYSFFTLLFLVAADPLQYPEVLAVWTLSSVIVGVFNRKRVVSVLSVLSTWLLIVSLSLVLVFGMVMEAKENIVLEEGMDSFEVMPPFPDGLTITTISEAPILGETYRFATDLMNEQPEELELSTVLTQFVNLFTFSIISKPLISVAFSLLGVELGKRIEHIFEPAISEKRLMLKKRLVPESKIFVALIILSCLCSTPVIAQSTDLYTENFIAIVNEDGKAMVAGAFAGTGLDDLDLEAFNCDGFMGCILVSHKDILDEVYEYVETPEEADFSGMLNLLPETIVAFLYIDVEPGKAQTHSDTVALELSTYYDMAINELFSFSQSIEDEEFIHIFTVNIYQSPITQEEFNTRYLQHFQEYGGYLESINPDQLIPGKGSDSVDGSLLFTGYLNPACVLDLVPVDTSLIPIAGTEVVGLSGFLGYWENSATILEDSLSIEEIFNQEDEPTDSYASDFSSITIIAPGIEGETNTLKMSTSIPIPIELQEMIEEELVIMGVQAELGGHATEALEISLTGVSLPLDLLATRDISINDENKVTVKITIKNQDNIAAEQVTVDDTASLTRYHNIAPDGNIVQRYTTIDPGETVSYEYTVIIMNPGIYTMNPVEISYRNGNRVYELQSISTSFNIQRPSLAENLGNTVNTVLDTDQELSQHIPDNLSTGLKITTYTVVIYSIANSLRKLRSWILS